MSKSSFYYQRAQLEKAVKHFKSVLFETTRPPFDWILRKLERKKKVKDTWERCNGEHNWIELENNFGHSYQVCGNFACTAKRIYIPFDHRHDVSVDCFGIWEGADIVIEAMKGVDAG